MWDLVTHVLLYIVLQRHPKLCNKALEYNRFSSIQISCTLGPVDTLDPFMLLSAYYPQISQARSLKQIQRLAPINPQTLSTTLLTSSGSTSILSVPRTFLHAPARSKGTSYPAHLLENIFLKSSSISIVVGTWLLNSSKSGPCSK